MAANTSASLAENRENRTWDISFRRTELPKAHLNLSANNKDSTHHRLILNFGRYLKQWSLKSLLYESVTEASTLYYPMKIHKRSFRIVGSVNGLICLSNRVNDLFVWNPSIRNSSDVEVKIYSLKSDSWRSIHSLPQRVRLSGLSWFVNGKLHWDNNTDRFFGNGCNIIYIDLADEKWGKMEQPSYGEGDTDLWLGLLGNDLSVNRNDKRKHVSVWVMKEYGVNESWSKMFTINYADYPYSYVLPLFMLNKGEVVVAFEKTFMIYNTNNDSLSPTTINFDGWWYKEIYVESLVSPFPTE
ncbi:F-box/kelch-repeat protein At3g23880-like [Nicotiana tomentosiformis]|uniref:F-box/kelch-repeat protein At3g23880-like n=1 Tax=Nicotiana tomentosiformis TaxID=4098 RepID=UPI00388CE5BA